MIVGGGPIGVELAGGKTRARLLPGAGGAMMHPVDSVKPMEQNEPYLRAWGEMAAVSLTRSLLGKNHCAAMHSRTRRANCRR